MRKPILVTGGCGFIGSHFVRQWLAEEGSPVINLDLLTYAGNPESLFEAREDARHHLVAGDIRDGELVGRLLREHSPGAVVHFAAESHVDRSIHGPDAFIKTNIEGTYALLQAVRGWWEELTGEEREEFRFLHVSTDEVYGSLGPEDARFCETTPYAPNSPYSASKAASDHLVRAWHHTFGLPVLTTNCTNNYGPAQFPEKLIPHVLLQALAGKPLPVYGRGENIRDWLYVEDHCSAIRRVLSAGRVGETYCVGGENEWTNLQVVEKICGLLDELRPRENGARYADLITFVTDRPGHDFRYAMDIGKIRRELGWSPARDFSQGLAETVRWYLENSAWIEHVRSGAYRGWVETNYAQR
jgi:dTDP-glucose 4,6-dehydratase